MASTITLPMTIPAMAPVDGFDDLSDGVSPSTAVDIPDDDAVVEMPLDITVASAAEGSELILLIRLSIDVLTSGGSD